MDADDPLPDSQPRKRFQKKADMAGWNPPKGRYEIGFFALETLGFVWPEKAYAFVQVMLGGSMNNVATDLQISEKQVHRYVAGEKSDLGAEDWYLIILELYREADLIVPDGATLLRKVFDCRFLDASGSLLPLHRSLFVLLLEALGAAPLSYLVGSLPWKPTEKESVIPWPSSGLAAPSPHSWLPGMIGLFRNCELGRDLSQLCLLLIMLWKSDSLKLADWRALMEVLRIQSSRKGSSTEADRVVHVMPQARQLLAEQPNALKYGLLGVLSRTGLPWGALCESIPDSDLGRLLPPLDVDRCIECFRAG